MTSLEQPPTRFATLASYLIVSCMVACGMVTVAQLGFLLLPGWSGGYLVVAGFFISLEVFYTERFRKRLVVFDSEWFIFYLSEWLVFSILLKAILLFNGGVDRLLVETAAWRGDFFEAFFNGEFLFSLAVIFIAWLVSLRVIRLSGSVSPVELASVIKTATNLSKLGDSSITLDLHLELRGKFNEHSVTVALSELKSRVAGLKVEDVKRAA